LFIAEPQELFFCARPDPKTTAPDESTRQEAKRTRCHGYFWQRYQLLLPLRFGPDLINRLSGEWKIPVNFMFVGSPGDHFPYRIDELGGVRLII